MHDVTTLERAEMTAWTEIFRAASWLTAEETGLELHHIDGAVASIVRCADVLALNRVVGLGLDAPPGGETIDRIVELYSNASVPRCFVQLSPVAHMDVTAAALAARGLTHYNNWIRLYRPAEGPIPEVSCHLDVRPIEPHEAGLFGAIVATGFGWPSEVAELVADTVGRPGWGHYMAFDGEIPVATGAFFLAGDLAWIDFAVTMEGKRGQGAQSALVARRIRDAAALGCQGFVVETAEQTPSKEAPSFRNMRRFGFEVQYARPNYVWTR